MEFSFDFSILERVVIRANAGPYCLEARAILIEKSGAITEILDINVRDSEIEIIVPAGKVNWFTQQVQVTLKDGRQFVPSPFELNLEKQHDVHYMNRTFFSPVTRIKEPNEFCEFARSAVEVMDPSGNFFCGVLSVLAYRVSEDPTLHVTLGHWLVNKRLELLSSSRTPTHPLWLRWWVSSAQTMTCLAIYYKKIDAAVSIADDAIQYSRFGYVNHMIYWNMASLMLIHGFILYKRERKVEAGAVFGQLFDLCENGLRDIFNPRNTALVTQHTDCIALVEIGRQAYACHFVCRGGVIPLESKFVQPMYLDSFYIDFVSAVKRFPEKFRPALTELMDAKKTLNADLAAVFGKNP